MAIRFSCGSCGKKFAAKEEHAGKQSKCPACGWPISVPPPSVQHPDEPPAAVPPPIPPAPAPVASIESSGQPERWRPKIGAPEVAGFTILAVVAIVAITWEAVHRPAPAAARIAPVRPAASNAASSRYTFLSTSIGEALVYEWGKDVFSIRLARKVSKATLEEIARQIESNKPTNPRTRMRNFRTMIFCYLPEVDAFGPDGPFGSPWALVDINGSEGKIGPEITINGLTIDEEIKLLAKEGPPSGDVVGTWLEDSLGKSLCFIYRRGGLLYFSHGGTFEEELVGFGPQPFRLFERKKRSTAGDYYRINDRGDLEMRDDNGLVAVARRVNLGGAPRPAK
jgi:hypothetical protein